MPDGGGSNVELSVKSQLSKIVEDLERISEQAKSVGEGLEDSSEQISEKMKNHTDETRTYLESLRNMGGRVADQLRRDFMSLISINAVQESLKLSDQFKNSVKEATTLSDTIRKVGESFGVARKDFVQFQSQMMKGLGEIGLSSEAGSRAMEGLVDTPVKGKDALLEYSKVAGQLASIAGEQGQEGKIAGGMAEVIRARGQDVNRVENIRRVAEDIRRVRTETGMNPSDMLNNMQRMFSGMSKDFRETISTRGLGQLAASGQVAGPASTKFLEEMLQKSPIARKALEAQGFKGIFGEQGIDTEQFKESADKILGRIGEDPRMAAQTLGISEEAAEGFIRLRENLDQVRQVQEDVRQSTGDLNKQYKESRGLGEAFSANINRVKKTLSDPFAFITQKGTELLNQAAESDAGAAGMVAGGGILAAMLAGMGLRGVGKGLGVAGGTFVRGGAAEAVTGQETQPVYVVNAAEIGMAASTGGLGGKMGGRFGKFAGKAGVAGAAGAVGYGVGTMVEPAVTEQLDKHTTGKVPGSDFKGNALERFFYDMTAAMGMNPQAKREAQQNNQTKIKVELNKKDLKVKQKQKRGASF